MDIGIFNEPLGEKVYGALTDIASYIDCNYNMDLLYNGKNELKFQRSKKTLVTLYVEDKTLTVLIIFGKAEREMFERERESFSGLINEYYEKSKTYHDGKWMFIDIDGSEYLGDILRMIAIKKKPDIKALTMCGYKCDLCKAYAKNIAKNDERAELSAAWHKYFNLDISSEDIYCDGCRSKKRDAKLADSHCPVRMCVMERCLSGCVQCDKYPCETFMLRKGLSICEANKVTGEGFSQMEYDTYIKAYDNKTRNDATKRLDNI